MRRQVWAAIVVASLGWGTAGVGVRAAFEQNVGPLAQVFLRPLIASAALTAWLWFRRGRLARDRHTVAVGLVLGAGNFFLPYVLFTLAYEHASAGFVGLIAALIPVVTAAMAHFALPDEQLSIAKLAGLLIAVVGVGILGFSGDSGLEGGEGNPALALTLGVAAVASIGAAGVYAKHQAGSYDPIEVSGIQFLAGTVLGLVAMMVFEGAPSDITASGWAIVAYLGVASTLVPFAAFYWVLRHTSIVHASITAYLVPIIAVAAGVIVLSEQLQPGILWGGGLILAGVVATDRLERRTVALRHAVTRP